MPVSLASVAVYLAVIDSGGFRAAASQLAATARRLFSTLRSALNATVRERLVPESG